MALPSCAVFNFHQTPPAKAATITMNTSRISSTGGRFAGAASATISGAAATSSVATVDSTLGAFSAGLSRTVVAGAALILVSTSFGSTTETAATRADGTIAGTGAT